MIRRNSLITAAAIAGVLFAGTTAVAANVGLLTPSETSTDAGSPVVSLETTLPSVEPQIVDVYIEDPPVTTDTTTATTTTTVASRSQVFAVEAAGTVSVEPTASGVRLDGVTVADGWQWTATQPSPNELQVTFTSTGATYVFSAGLAPDGTIVAGVDQPIVQIAPAPAAALARTTVTTDRPAATAPAPTGEHGEDHGDDHDEYEYEDGESDD